MFFLIFFSRSRSRSHLHFTESCSKFQNFFSLQGETNRVGLPTIFIRLDNQPLADWILQDQLPVRFQAQSYKMIWGDVVGK